MPRFGRRSGSLFIKFPAGQTLTAGFRATIWDTSGLRKGALALIALQPHSIFRSANAAVGDATSFTVRPLKKVTPLMAGFAEQKMLGVGARLTPERPFGVLRYPKSWHGTQRLRSDPQGTY